MNLDKFICAFFGDNTAKKKPANHSPFEESEEEMDEAKSCPNCGQTIKAEALVCRFCGARFEIVWRGYCLNDHAIADIKDGKCARCGNEARDVHPEYRMVDAPAATALKPTLNAEKPSQVEAAPPKTLKRPGCVTAYAILLFFGAGLLLLAGLSGGESYSEISPEAGGVIALVILIAAALNVTIAIGLWQLKNWARILTLIVTGLGMASNMLAILIMFLKPPGAPLYMPNAYYNQLAIGLIGNFIGLIINSTIYGWFQKNGKYFVQKTIPADSGRESILPANPPEAKSMRAEAAAPAQPSEPQSANANAAAPRQSTGWIFLIIAALMVILALTLGGLKPENANSTAAAQLAWAEDFADPILAAIKDSPPNFEDDFSSGKRGQWDTSGGSVTFSDGVMRMNGTGWIAASHSMAATDFVVKFDITPRISGKDSGFAVNYRVENGEWYNFDCNFYDSWCGMLGFFGGNDPVELAGKMGGGNPKEKRTIMVMARGDEFGFYVNDKPFAYVKDIRLKGAWVEMGVYSPNEISEADFDNVKFWDLNNLKR